MSDLVKEAGERQEQCYCNEIDTLKDGDERCRECLIRDFADEVVRLEERWSYIKADPEGARHLLRLLMDGMGSPDDFDSMIDRIIKSKRNTKGGRP